MGQRVSIQYSVDIEDLEMEVATMVKRAASKLEGCGEDLGHTVGVAQQSPCLTVKMIEELTSFRKAIAKIDYTLEDISNIISSYVAYKVQPPEEETQLSVPDADEQLELLEEQSDSMPSNIEQIQKMINSFKNSMETDEVSD